MYAPHENRRWAEHLAPQAGRAQQEREGGRVTLGPCSLTDKFFSFLRGDAEKEEASHLDKRGSAYSISQGRSTRKRERLSLQICPKPSSWPSSPNLVIFKDSLSQWWRQFPSKGQHQESSGRNGSCSLLTMFCPLEPSVFGTCTFLWHSLAETTLLVPAEPPSQPPWVLTATQAPSTLEPERSLETTVSKSPTLHYTLQPLFML